MAEDDRIAEPEELVVALERELAIVRGQAREHFTARLEAERDAADGQRRGVLLAVRWIRDMPARMLTDQRIQVGAEIYQRVAMSVARYLERRLDTCEETTSPSLPPSSSSE